MIDVTLTVYYNQAKPSPTGRVQTDSYMASLLAMAGHEVGLDRDLA